MTSIRTRAETSILPLVARPNRYIGNHAPRDPGRFESALLRAVVVHPDLFETGFSDADTRAAWAALDAAPGTAADLAFLPRTDLEALLREKGVPLWGLETFRPLDAFDLILFTPAHPLQYVNLVRILDLAGLPLSAADRADRAPLVAALGAPLANPAPLAGFLDLALLGDPRAVLPAVASALLAARGAPRRERLAALRGVPGTAFPGGCGTAGASAPESAAASPGAAGPVLVAPEIPPAADPLLLPLGEVEEEALFLEIRRGGVHNRFEPGWGLATPPRELAVEEAFERVEMGLRATGLDRVDLRGDQPWAHGNLLRLVEGLVRRHPGLRITLDDFGISQPSAALARELQRGRRGAFRWSPWAGSDRLRRVLNATFDETAFLEAVAAALRGGCHMARFRFGIGWPTETDEDLAALADLVRRARATVGAGQPPPRCQVLLVPFVPRPGTPLQWEAQLPAAELARRVARVRRDVEHGPVQVRCAPAELPLIEAVLARGGPETGPLLVAAMRGGAATPRPGEDWSPAPWLAALEEAGLSTAAAIAARSPDAALPWDFIDPGLPREGLREERRRALAAEPTAPRELEMAARAAARFVAARPASPAAPAEVSPVGDAFGRRGRRRSGPAGAPRQSQRYRLRFAKDEEVRFTAHLDVGRAFERALRRAGFTPGSSRPRGVKLSFGPPLPLGMTSEDEYLDLKFVDEVPETAVAGLADLVPHGFRVLDTRPVRSSVESLSQSIDRAAYRIEFPAPLREALGLLDPAALAERLEAGAARVLALTEIPLPRNPGEELPGVDARPALRSLAAVTGPDGGAALRVQLALDVPGCPRPEALLPILCGAPVEGRLARIHRLELRISGADREFSPLEVVELDFPWWRETLKRRAAGARP